MAFYFWELKRWRRCRDIIVIMLTKKELIDQLAVLVACESLSGNVTENKKALDHVTGWLDKSAFVKRVQNGKAEILIAGNIDILTPDVAYLVHMDVVAGTPDQFKMKIDGDKLIGRGTSDMKFSVPIGIALLNELIGNDKLNFALVITTDEEVGGFEGTNYLVNEMGYKPKLLIVPYGGDNFVFVDKAKGVCQLFVESKGVPAHASRVWLGKNALEPLVELSHQLMVKYRENNARESWKTTMNIGVFEGGISVNQVCASGILKLDFRFPETESEEEITKEVTELAKKIDPQLKITSGVGGLPTFTDKNLPIVTKFLKIMAKAVGSEIAVKPTYGASDARWFSGQNTPVLMIKPIGGEIHSNDEWISLSSCLKFYEGIHGFLLVCYRNHR